MSQGQLYDLTALYNYLKAGCNEVGVGSFFQKQVLGQEKNDITIHREGLDWILGRISSAKRSASIGTGCPGNCWGESPSQEVFKGHADVVLRDVV